MEVAEIGLALLYSEIGLSGLPGDPIRVSGPLSGPAGPGEGPIVPPDLPHVPSHSEISQSNEIRKEREERERE